MTSPIDQAVTSVEDLGEVTVLQEPYWSSTESKWIVQVAIAPGGLEDHPDIPAETEWYIHLDDTYPWGNIQLYPAKENGISATFPHQHINLTGDNDKPWRTGDICVARYGWKIGRSGATAEPDAAEDRLRWYLERAIEWLEAASKERLRKAGEPYEIPDFNTHSSPDHTVAFNERYEMLETWESAIGEWGVVELTTLTEPSDVFLTTRFRRSDDDVLYEPNWGDFLDDEQGTEFPGVWLLLDEPPFESPWQAPETWAEMAAVMEGTEIDVFELLSVTKRLLEDEEFSLLLIGFPIPKKVGGSSQVIHWQPVEILEFIETSEIPGGFRPTPRGEKRAQRIGKRTKQIRWLDSENWAHQQLTRRGSFPDQVTGATILLVGAGALGSTLAENLVRSGCQHLVVMDGEQVEIGNMARHTLTVQDIGSNKAQALAARLQRLSPNASIDSVHESYPPRENPEQLTDADIVIDCTGSDTVLHSLQHFGWTDPTLFVSVSMGRRANRFFYFSSYSYSFPHERFRDDYRPWALQEQVEWQEGEDAVPERVGCWHPASVIRMDRVSMWAGIASRMLSKNHRLKLGETVFKALETRSDEHSTVAPAEEPFQHVSTWGSDQSSIEVELPRECMARMRDMCSEAGDVETGGILAGIYESSTKARVITVDEPPRDSVHTPTMFHRGTEEVDEWLREARESLGIRYLGEWHYHPGGSPEPSEPDKSEMIGIAESGEYACPDPILIVVGENSENSLSSAVYVFHRDGDLERLDLSDTQGSPKDGLNEGVTH